MNPSVRGRRPETSGRRPAAWPVMLVSMPFMDADQPSIQLGLLTAIVSGHGYPVDALHANLDLAARIGPDVYRALAAHRGRMVGDWLFSVEAFGDLAPDPDGRLLDDFVDDTSFLGDTPAESREALLRIRREEIPAYLDGLVEACDWDKVRVVGFTSTFQQTAASFALARRLKSRHPGLVTVFGGANFDGEMGLEFARAVDCVDLVVVGEGDLALPRLLDALAGGEDPGTVAGVAYRRGDTVAAVPPGPPLRRLDDLPVPDYSEYFERAEQLDLLPRVGQRRVSIPFESARGCWWGAKHHCTFCGLNGATMQFRAKSPRRVLAELAEQARRCRSFLFEAVDNILDMAYLRELFPELIANGSDYELFYEVKANLTREQLKLMALAGVTRIQPGLESLSSPVLALMRKGVRAAQNVNVLRWAQYYNIHVDWNLIWGFPGETAEEYAAQAALVPALVHLRPPAGAGRVWMERFSPLYSDPAAFPVRRRVPERSYGYVYPPEVDLERVAYFFEYEFDGALPDAAYDDLRTAVDRWRAAWDAGSPPVLRYWSSPGFLQIYDGRHEGAEGTYTFEGPLAAIYLACVDRPRTAAAVRAKLELNLTTEVVRGVCEEFGRRGLMFLDGDLALSLALPSVPGR